MSQVSVRALSAVLFILSAGVLRATPVQWSGNGHFYDVILVPATISWEEANRAARAAGGYLATITSPAENAFVFGLVNYPACWHGYSGPWLGGYQDPGTLAPRANWRWVTGEPWDYANWQSGQPNHSGGKLEDKLQFGFGPVAPVWNDILSVDPTSAYRPMAYVLEWDHDPSAAVLEIRFSPSGSTIELCWQAAENRFYRLEYSSTLAPALWVPLHNDWLQGDGTSHCVSQDPRASESVRFYRLAVRDAP
jgi:hypothetical protein